MLDIFYNVLKTKVNKGEYERNLRILFKCKIIQYNILLFLTVYLQKYVRVTSVAAGAFFSRGGLCKQTYTQTQNIMRSYSVASRQGPLGPL